MRPEQSKAEITAWLSTPAIMQNVACAYYLRDCYFCQFCIYAVATSIGNKSKKVSDDTVEYLSGLTFVAWFSILFWHNCFMHCREYLSTQFHTGLQ